MRRSASPKRAGYVPVGAAKQYYQGLIAKQTASNASKENSWRGSTGMKELLLSDRKYVRIMGIDPSSHKIATCLLEYGKPTSLVALDLGGGDLYARLYEVRRRFPKILDLYGPHYVCVEQTILIQNPETSRKLSYVVGTLMAEVLIRDIPIIDIPPPTWKAKLGVKPVTKKWKESIISELGETDGRKEIDRLRKNQTQARLKERFPEFKWSDHDLADACGIALYAFSQYGAVAD